MNKDQKYFCPYTLTKSPDFVFICEGPSHADLRNKTLLTHWSPEGKVFKEALAERGIIQSKVSLLAVSRYRAPGGSFHAHPRQRLSDEISVLRDTLKSLSPRVVVAMGDYAAWALAPDEWPTKKDSGRIEDATGVMDMRGFVFDSPFTDAPVVVTVEPGMVQKSWVPWRVLFSLDLKRAKEIVREGFERPVREVVIL